MKIIFDQETDSLSIIFKEGNIAESDEVKEGVIFDYGENGDILSMEILDASVYISEPQGILYELKKADKACA